MEPEQVAVSLTALAERMSALGARVDGVGSTLKAIGNELTDLKETTAGTIGELKAQQVDVWHAIRAQDAQIAELRALVNKHVESDLHQVQALLKAGPGRGMSRRERWWVGTTLGIVTIVVSVIGLVLSHA